MEIERQIPVQLSARLYFALSARLAHTNDKRTVHEIASLAVKQWLGEIGEKKRLSGYQWGPLFLPDGSEVRLRYKRGNYIARVIGDALKYEGRAMTPREFGIAVTGSVRNVWRDAWIRRAPRDGWTKAAILKNGCARFPILPFEERRKRHRRCLD